MELRTRATGSTALGIKSSQLQSTLVAIPPIAEQEAVTRVLHDGIQQLELQMMKVREAIDRLTEFRTALISAAVTGKIDVRDTLAGCGPANAAPPQRGPALQQGKD